ncbi:Eaa2 [Salmonella enterica]|nr:Eaa2 [Salmonella enterica]
MTTITKEQLHERARRKVKELEFAITQSAFTSIRDGLKEELKLAEIALASLEAEPVSQTYKLPELIEGMEVSIDVSTCDADAGNRYFGTVTEVSELYTAKNGYILLVQDAEPNFDVNGNSPVTPDGYALVPVEPTDEMIAAAMNCEDVLFNSDESFCVQFGNIYEAMLAAAPQK